VSDEDDDVPTTLTRADDDIEEISDAIEYCDGDDVDDYQQPEVTSEVNNDKRWVTATM